MVRKGSGNARLQFGLVTVHTKSVSRAKPSQTILAWQFKVGHSSADRLGLA